MQTRKCLILTALLCFSVPTFGQTPPAATTLHPAFIFSADEVANLIKKGEDAARGHKMPDDLAGALKQRPRWVRGKKGTIHESAVYCWTIEGASIALQAYTAAVEYKPDPSIEQLRGGVTARAIEFQATLTSEPMVRGRGRHRHVQDADEEDVRVRRFVLTDDRGRAYEADPDSTEGKETSGTKTLSGTSVSTRWHPGSTTNFQAYTPGGPISGTATTYPTIEHEYTPWSAERPYFTSRYWVRFPLFDKDGKPLIGPDVKEISLHLITASGEQEVTYRLPSASTSHVRKK